MSGLLTFLGLAHAPHAKTKVKEQAVNGPDNRDAIKLTQLESYLSADDNQGIANLALYL